MKIATTKIIARLGIVVLVLSVAIFANFLRGESPGITFATQGIDLKIDNKSYYNGSLVPGSTWYLKNLIPTSDKFFNFSDIKPGDYGKDLISVHVDKSSAWLCLDFLNLVSKDNGVNEPESLVDTNEVLNGELASGTEFFAWLDNGNGTWSPGEKILFGAGAQSADVVLNNTSYIIGDSGVGGECKINQTRWVGIYWCAGNLSVNTTTGAVLCDGGALGNEAQTDSFSVDMVLRASPSPQNPKFLCSTDAPKHPKKDKEDDRGHNNNYGNFGGHSWNWNNAFPW